MTQAEVGVFWQDTLRVDDDETHRARQGLFDRARRLYNVAKTEAAKNPIKAERKLRQVMDWIEDAGLQTGPTGFEFLTSAEAISR